jgi:hypothetical protein
VERPHGGTRRDAVAQGGKRIGGQCRGARTRATARRNNGNLGGGASERAVEEIWGKTAPTGGAQLAVTAAREG